MFEFLYDIDKSILYFCNHGLNNQPFTNFFSYITNVKHWYLVYVIFISLLIVKGGVKGRVAAFFTIILVVICDQGGVIIKNLVDRDRPCDVLTDLILPIGCAGAKSFPSNHALNNFAVATFFSRLYPQYTKVLFISAFLIAFSRVYLGVHYPSDILGGAILGVGAGYILSVLSLKSEDKINSLLKSRSEKKSEVS